jgi:hypothetical protein
MRFLPSMFHGLLLAVAASACGGPACPQQMHTDAKVLLDRHRSLRPTITTLRAEAKVDQRSKEGRIKGKVMMFLERPDHVRFDAITQFGPALILTSDGQNFALSDFKEGRFLTGPACERNIARMIGVALSGADVVSVLMGDAPELDRPAALQCSGEGGYTVAVEHGGLRRELELAVDEADLKKPPAEQRTRLVGAVLRDTNGKVVYRVRYADYRTVKGGVMLPFTVHVIDERGDADALLHFQDIAVGVTIPDGAFTQSTRPGLTLEEVGCE